jgi:electron transfer flavoprotein alpha subunit
MSVLVVAEQRDGEFKRGAFEAVRAGSDLAAKLGTELHVCALGSGISEGAKALGGYGAAKVLVADDAAFAHYRGEVWAPAVAAIAKQVGADTVLLGASLQGKDLGPQVAGALEAGYVGDCVALDVDGGALVATRPVYSGKAFAKLSPNGAPIVCSLRPNVFTAGDSSGDDAAVEAASATAGESKSAIAEVKAAADAKQDLTEAAAIVAGGRGMGGPEHFALLDALAAKLDAVVGASRAVVDDGWRPHGDQVGQTGKVVAPQLYIAVGISGAIQHLAGMRTSKVIVAINKDAEAPIFKVADYGIVGDLFEVVPALTEAL